MSYCVYLTAYSGDCMPPFYVGSAAISRVLKGYHGSVSSQRYGSIWASELRENPDAFKTIIVSEHTTRKEAYEEEARIHVLLNVVHSDMFLNEAIANGKFSTLGKKHSVETRAKMASKATGRTHAGNRNYVPTPEALAKIAAANRKRVGEKRSAEARARMSASQLERRRKEKL